jgi:general stress protein YciG
MSKQGFASMDPAKQREVASAGGKAIAPEKRAFSRDPQLAARAGRAGGLASVAAKRARKAAQMGAI